MNRGRRFSVPRRLFSVVAAALALAAGACGPAEPYVPVRGTVRLNGQPVTDGLVMYYPNASKGNQRLGVCTAVLQSDGSYDMRADQQAGMPLGWYKVVVQAPTPPQSVREQVPRRDPKTKLPQFEPIHWILGSKYTQPHTTPLSVEVVKDPQPGAYDLSVTK
jgi:hypothetical protein